MGDLATDRLREIERMREISSRKDDEIAKLLREPLELRDRVIELEQEIGRLKAERDGYKSDYETAAENYEAWQARAEAAEKERDAERRHSQNCTLAMVRANDQALEAIARAEAAEKERDESP